MRLFLILFAASSAWAQELPAFLAGCWTLERGGTVIEELWMRPAGNTMLGVSRTVRNGQTISAEFMQIRQENGKLVYVAQPKFGGPTTPFALLKASDSEVVFSNPEHDFPQRVIYRKQADGSLFARVEGSRNGKESGQDFPYKRTVCP